MKTYLDYLPCFMSQALSVGRMTTNDEKKIKVLLDEVGCMIKDIPMENTPPETGFYHWTFTCLGVFVLFENSNTYQKIN